MILESIITCPWCSHKEVEMMPANQCIWFYECKSCEILLSPLKGDCCVFCSYADEVCPSMQSGDCGC
jgi:hypothetical protein